MGSETTTKFKIGDKVRIVKFPDSHMVGEICEVVDIEGYPSKFVCRVETINVKHWGCLMYPGEIEPCLRKDEQLLFPFME